MQKDTNTTAAQIKALAENGFGSFMIVNMLKRAGHTGQEAVSLAKAHAPETFAAAPSAVERAASEVLRGAINSALNL